LTLGALGVVFGDIGTNPLYALRQCCQSLPADQLRPEAIIGLLSLIVWSLVLVVCVKYLTFILRADHDGEGGTLAMLALIQSRHPAPRWRRPGLLVLLVLFASALLYGDGVITPAISVLSAVEGLKLAAPATHRFVLPLALGILVGLFLLQRRGTGRIGRLFGPVMAVWFIAIAALGSRGIAIEPGVLRALNPALGGKFLLDHGTAGFSILGGVVLCFAGAEALFADLSHFGRQPIRLAWYGLVLPSLVLNYFGQGAWLMRHPGDAAQPFFALVPDSLRYPAVALATAATIIASQALISGVFTLTQQAIHLGYAPPFEVSQTSRTSRGQIYIASINHLLLIACVLIVLGFRSSARLGGAYGLAVMGTMAITSLTYFVVLRRVWRWPKPGAVALAAAFLLIDLLFLIGNLGKLASGAWVPLVLAAVIFALSWIWTAGRARSRRALHDWAMPLERFRRQLESWNDRQGGTGVFLTTHPDSVPLVGRNLWLREHIRPEQVLLITVIQEPIPYVPKHAMSRTERLGPGFWRVTARFGFMQHPDVTEVLKRLPSGSVELSWSRLACYLPDLVIVNRGSRWRRTLQQTYDFMARNSLSAAHYFRIPARDIIRVGVRLEI